MFGPGGVQRVFADRAIFSRAPSADPNMASNLYTFLAMRASQSFTNLHCGRLTRTADPVTLVTNADGVVIGATFHATTPPSPSLSPSPGTSPRR